MAPDETLARGRHERYDTSPLGRCLGEDGGVSAQPLFFRCRLPDGVNIHEHDLRVSGGKRFDRVGDAALTELTYPGGDPDAVVHIPRHAEQTRRDRVDEHHHVGRMSGATQRSTDLANRVRMTRLGREDSPNARAPGDQDNGHKRETKGWPNSPERQSRQEYRGRQPGQRVARNQRGMSSADEIEDDRPQAGSEDQQPKQAVPSRQYPVRRPAPEGNDRQRQGEPDQPPAPARAIPGTLAGEEAPGEPEGRG